MPYNQSTLRYFYVCLMAQIGIQIFGLEDVKTVRCFNVLSKCLLGSVADAGSKIWSALSRHNGDLTALSSNIVYSEWTYDQKMSQRCQNSKTLGPADFGPMCSNNHPKFEETNLHQTNHTRREVEVTWRRERSFLWHFIELHRGFHMASRASQKRSQLVRYARSRFEERSSERETFDASVLMERFGQAPWWVDWVVCFWNWWSGKPPNRGSPYWKQHNLLLLCPQFFYPHFLKQKSLRYPVTVMIFSRHH